MTFKWTVAERRVCATCPEEHWDVVVSAFLTVNPWGGYKPTVNQITIDHGYG
ncbi:MAG: hypothetical protein ACRD18_00505 [Terriglobia bacterium]